MKVKELIKILEVMAQEKEIDLLFYIKDSHEGNYTLSNTLSGFKALDNKIILTCETEDGDV